MYAIEHIRMCTAHPLAKKYTTYPEASAATHDLAQLRAGILGPPYRAQWIGSRDCAIFDNRTNVKWEVFRIRGA